MKDGFAKSLKTLEFDKILRILSSLAATEGAAERILNLFPSDDDVIVNRLLDETTRAAELITLKGMPPFGRAKDILPAVERAKKGAVLTPRELLDIASLLRSVSSVKKYALAKSEENSVLDRYFSQLAENPQLEKKISNAIAAEDIISDNASDRLYKIRRDIKKCENSVKDALASFTSGAYSKYLQENLITMRSGRYVIPVKAEHRGDIKGLIHDTSASGATLFIEPLAVLEANNKLRELQADEANEIERILSELSGFAADNDALLITDYGAMTDLAVIFAKASYSLNTNASRPVITRDRNIRLVNARHPLLDKEKVVPINLEFGKKQSTLIITGPNTGGKTVTLKTIGLLSLMAQTGLHLPCDYGSTVPLFKSVLADIGDEQSIEQSLSTFSSHMVNLVSILKSCNADSLVLLDELGAGTDPVEGAALAISILEKTKNLGAITAATTHYSELKIYALETAGVLNASCEFDVETLRPTYRLITGLPGKSNAFAISLRLGLDPVIIDRAKALMAEDNKHFEDVLGRLEDTENKLEKEKQRAARARAEADAILEAAKKQSREILAKAKTELDKAHVQAQRMISSTKASSELVFDELNKLRREKEKLLTKEQLDKARADIRRSIKNVESNFSTKGENEIDDEEYRPPRPFKEGDSVLLRDVNKTGIIQSISGDAAKVRAGIIDVKTSLSNLRLNEITEKKSKKGSSFFERTTAPVKLEFDVRGQTGDDAWFMIDRYLDDCIQAGYETVSIIHGKGTGALRSALWQYFKSDKRIESFRSGRYGEGDLGVTILTIKK
ncbi:MAG: endonuclease MutS2 [Eubacteriales bacterium]|nr:endonuclease MutS2 [Eubacteriales bacterium]